jgi:hypothetical protein
MWETYVGSEHLVFSCQPSNIAPGKPAPPLRSHAKKPHANAWRRIQEKKIREAWVQKHKSCSLPGDPPPATAAAAKEAATTTAATAATYAAVAEAASTAARRSLTNVETAAATATAPCADATTAAVAAITTATAAAVFKMRAAARRGVGVVTNLPMSALPRKRRQQRTTYSSSSLSFDVSPGPVPERHCVLSGLMIGDVQMRVL